MCAFQRVSDHVRGVPPAGRRQDLGIHQGKYFQGDQPSAGYLNTVTMSPFFRLPTPIPSLSSLTTSPTNTRPCQTR
jgi:hypothetical protein